MNFYKRYPGDYGRDTALLSLVEHGAYTLLLDQYYSTERALPAELEALFRICRAFSKDEQRAVTRVAEQFFPVGADGLRHNTRADRQIPQELKSIDAARENGKRGGRPVKAASQQNPLGFDGETQSEPKQNPLGLPNESEAEPTAKTPHPHTLRDQKHLAQQAARFDEFWDLYPNRKGKADALAKWKARGLDAIADRILEDVRNRIERDPDWLRGYPPHGSTYVNQKGWEDDIPPPRGVNGTPAASDNQRPIGRDFTGSARR